MLARLTSGFVTFFERWMPDAFVVAVVLSVITFLLSIVVAGASPSEAVTAWGDGFWNLLTFTNQIVLILLFGHTLAHTPAIQRILKGTARFVHTPDTAYITVAFISCIASLFYSALGLVAGAVAARAVGAAARQRKIPVHYPLLVACAFCGIVIWHQGISSSIGLVIATPGHFLEHLIGVVPSSQTVFTLWNITIAAVILFTLPFLMARLRPADNACQPMPEDLAAEETAEEPDVEKRDTPAAMIENGRWINIIIVAAGAAYLYIEYIMRGHGLDLNRLNFMFLITSIALTRSPAHFLKLIVNASRIIGPFLLQYPFYAGIAGMMATTGLAQSVVNLFVEISTAQTLPISSFFSGALLNLFIPSGGGQWAVQGPIAMQAAIELGADIPTVAMAVAFGDQWTNLIHPLIAFPVLAIAGLKARDIMGYCAIALLYTGPIFLISILLII